MEFMAWPRGLSLFCPRAPGAGGQVAFNVLVVCQDEGEHLRRHSGGPAVPLNTSSARILAFTFVCSWEGGTSSRWFALLTFCI